MTTVQKRLTSLGLSVVVLGALAAYAYYGTYQGKKKEEEEKKAEEKVASFTLADVKQVRLQTKGVTYEMVADGEGERKWRITQPLATAGERSSIDQIVTHFADMKRTRTVDSADKAAFGLEPPVATVAFKVGDKDVTFLVGKKNSFNDNVYLLKDGDTKVSMVPGGITYQTERDLFALREKRVVLFQDSDVTKIEVDLQGKHAYTLEKKGSDWMLSPELKADSAQVSTILATLRGLRAKTFPAEKVDDPKKYGFDKPVAVATLTIGSAKARIEFGDVKESHFAHVDGPVFEIQDDAKKLNVTQAELRDKTVLSFTRDEVKKIKLAETGKDFILLEKKDSAWEVAAPEQKPANDGKVSNLLYKLSTLKAKAIIADKVTPELKKKHGLDPVGKQITLYKADGAEAGTLIIGSTDGDLTAMTAAGRERLDGVEKAQLADVSFEVKDYIKEEAAPVATKPTE